MNFLIKKKNERIILMTTKAEKKYTDFKFKKMTLYYLAEKALVFLKKYIKKSKIN